MTGKLIREPGSSADADRASRQLELLARLSHALIQRVDLRQVLGQVLDLLDAQMGMTRAIVTLRRPGSDLFCIEAARGLTAGEQQRGTYRLGEGIVGRVAATRQPECVADISADPRFLNKTGSRPDNLPVAFLCVPILHQQETIGTLSIDRQVDDTHVLSTDLNFLRLVADLLAESVACYREEQHERDVLRQENRALREQLGEQYRPDNIIGRCSAMEQVYRQIAQVAPSSATVLVRGESGTGKELVARAIHYSSPRRDYPFIAVNCAALPENLIESELFGHEKGAFSGAVQQRKGRFELAQQGTIFLDEIGDIAPAVQVRLLRVLQERTFERVGGTDSIEIDIRVIAATARNLEDAISSSQFREDLFYRLNVFPIHMPPLRHRRSDIMLLADFFLRRYCQLYDKQIKRISTEAINMMMAYHWPGNVRELENCIERAVLTSTDEVVHGYTLPPSLQTSDATDSALLPS